MIRISLVAAGVILAGGLMSGAAAQTEESDAEAMQIAVNSAACGDRVISSARWSEDRSQVLVRCGTQRLAAATGEEVTGFVPLLGGLGPALGIGATVVAAGVAAAGGGGSTPDTQ